MSFWQGKRVFVTGHSGFKGSWLSFWLLQLGALVRGYSLEPETRPALFEQLRLTHELENQLGDIRDGATLANTMREFQPDVVLHLAAQPLVRHSYTEPLLTWETNVLGTIHVLESLKGLRSPCAAVLITTDKCYENREWVYGYREEDPLGGYDPYSSSKAGAEIAISSWRRSFFNPLQTGIGVASARAGNVIGGGDWSEDRIVPDAIRALQAGKVIPVRNPHATRPWQHVLEPISGYLQLAEKIYQALEKGHAAHLDSLCTAFNFGPALHSNRPVGELVVAMLQHWPGNWQDESDPDAPHEAGLLNLVTDKAYHHLGWQPRWGFQETIYRTVDWYQSWHKGNDPRMLCLQQLQAYETSLINNA